MCQFTLLTHGLFLSLQPLNPFIYRFIRAACDTEESMFTYGHMMLFSPPSLRFCDPAWSCSHLSSCTSRNRPYIVLKNQEEEEMFLSAHRNLRKPRGINTHTHTHTSVEALLAGLRAAGREAGKTPTKEPAASCMN